MMQMNIPTQKAEISISEFDKLDIRVGTILAAETFPEARKPAYKLQINLGIIGTKWSSAQITHHYKPEDIIGRQVIVLVNLPKLKIANFYSECLVLGIYDPDGNVILLNAGKKMPDGSVIG